MITTHFIPDPFKQHDRCQALNTLSNKQLIDVAAYALLLESKDDSLGEHIDALRALSHPS